MNITIKCHTHTLQTNPRKQHDEETQNTYSRQEVKKRAKIRNRHDRALHLTQDTNGKATTSQLDITNESQDVSSFPACDHKAPINRAHESMTKTRQK